MQGFQIVMHPCTGESIEAVRSISRHIQQLRNNGLGLAQHLKGESLQRYGSCPILHIQGRCTPPNNNVNPDHHKSMLDLAKGSGHLYPADTDTVFGTDPTSNIYSSDVYASDSNESSVRICINGVTVDSSEDHLPLFPSAAAAASVSSIAAAFIKTTGDNLHTGDSTDFSTATTTTTSAITASSTTAAAASVLGRGKDSAGAAGHGDHSGVGYHKEVKGHHRVSSESSQRNFWNHVKSTMASLGSKSHSLSSLTGADESDEDSFHDARENPTPSQSMMNLSMPPDSIYGHHRIANTGENMYIHNTLLNETNRPPSWPLPVRVEHQKIPREVLEHHSLSSKSPQGSDSADEFSSTLTPYSSLAPTTNQNITKSLSTSCIPAATANDDTKGAMSLMKRNNKFYIPNLEDNEKFRRQQEIEEIDEVAEMNKEAAEPRKGREKKELGLTLNEFLNSLPKEDKEKEKKEEKKRRPNVLAKFGSTRKKTKKVKDGKEKENKHKNTHQFVSLSISNTALCHVCNKSMANKSAVQCENCLVNVHESSCKEQVGPCAKLFKAKFQACSQEGTSHGQLREKQFASLPAPTSKALDAMKRSSSVPVRPQSAIPMYHQRHSLPNQGIAEENEDPEQQEHIHTNINETISESMESLDESSAAESVDQIVLENDPLLRIEDDELEAWSISVDKKVVKKLSSKEVKRQDNIYELIQTEKNYCRALTIMQKMFYEGLRNEVGVHVDVLNAMFPCLDILLHSHKTFLNNLTILQSQHKDKIIEEIGKALIEQFDGENAMTLKHAYGHFCSHHIEAADIYKEKKGERKFLSFVKRCANNSICQKREIPDFLLLVTQRLTKYPTLIEAIIKNTKDKKERENLNKALELVKDILSSVNNQVEEYEREQRLSDIYNRTDARSSALFRSRKFKKTDLRLNQRKLIHDGVIGWKTTRGKVIDVIAVVLTDLIVLMQESNQKYTFIMQDNKSCVIPLCELLVREKGDTKDGKGIYLITKKNTQPEMYEFVCKSTEDMKNWIVLLRSAVEQCPQEVVDNLAFQKLEVKRLLELRAEKMTKLFDSMTHIDTEIVRLCEEKKNKINEYVELYNYSTVDETNTSTNMSAQSTTSTSSGTTTSTTSSSSSSSSTTVTSAVVATGDKCQSKEEGPDAWELLQKAMDEITRLTKVLRSIGMCQTPFVVAGTEHLGSSTITHAAPKRAETFAGFDSLDLRKEPVHKRQLSYAHPDGRSSSMFNLSESETLSAKDANKMNFRKSAGYLHSMMAKNSPVEGLDAGQTVSWTGSVGSSEMLPLSTPSSSVPSIPDSTGSPSSASLVSTTAAITNASDRLCNAVQLSQFLHGFVELSVQQSTALEGMRQQLMEAHDRIARLMAEKSEINKHSQLEGLRNLKEEVTRERQELEQEKKRRAESLEKAREEMQKEWDDIRAQKDELHRKREVFQKQYDLWEEYRFNGTAGRSQNIAEKSQNLDAHGTNHNTGHSPIMHKRSASAELSSQAPDDYMSSGKDLKELSKQQQHRSSVGNLHHKPIPMQLYSATNEQRVSEKMKQHLPLQLANTGNSATLPTTGKSASGISQSQQSGLNRAGLGRSASNTSFSLVRENSSLSQVMKLAEPCRSAPKERAQSHPQTGISKSDQKQLYF